MAVAVGELDVGSEEDVRSGFEGPLNDWAYGLGLEF